MISYRNEGWKVAYCVHESQHVAVGQPLAHDPVAGGDAARDPAPDPEAALPDREDAPEVVRLDLTGGRDHEVDPPADQPGREAPGGSLVCEVRIPARLPPSPPGDEDRRRNGEHVREPVGVDEQRPDIEAVVRGAGDVRRDDHARGRARRE
jgi:hypothetical protein